MRLKSAANCCYGARALFGAALVWLLVGCGGQEEPSEAAQHDEIAEAAQAVKGYSNRKTYTTKKKECNRTDVKCCWGRFKSRKLKWGQIKRLKLKGTQNDQCFMGCYSTRALEKAFPDYFDFPKKKKSYFICAVQHN